MGLLGFFTVKLAFLLGLILGSFLPATTSTGPNGWQSQCKAASRGCETPSERTAQAANKLPVLNFRQLIL